MSGCVGVWVRGYGCVGVGMSMGGRLLVWRYVSGCVGVGVWVWLCGCVYVEECERVCGYGYGCVDI